MQRCIWNPVTVMLGGCWRLVVKAQCIKIDPDTWDRLRKSLHCVHCEFCHVLHALKCNFLHNIYQHVTREPLDGKTCFQTHIVGQLKSYLMVVESWESDEANLDAPLFARHFFERLWMACTKPFTVELMDVSGYETWMGRKYKNCSVFWSLES